MPTASPAAPASTHFRDTDDVFIRATSLPFARPDTPAELTTAFTHLRDAVAAVAGSRDADTLAELFWAALHGLVTLHRHGRLRPGFRHERVDLLVAEFARAAPL